MAKVWDTKIKESHPRFIGAGIGYGSGQASGLGYNIFGGYSFNQNIAIENNFFVTPAYPGKDYTYTFSTSAKITFPLPNNLLRHVFPYLLTGVAFTHWPSPESTHAGILIGAGADYRMQHNIEVGCKWITSSSASDPTIIVATVDLRF